VASGTQKETKHVLVNATILVREKRNALMRTNATSKMRSYTPKRK
jgi:hypothetical protein